MFTTFSIGNDTYRVCRNGPVKFSVLNDNLEWQDIDETTIPQLMLNVPDEHYRILKTKYKRYWAMMAIKNDLFYCIYRLPESKMELNEYISTLPYDRLNYEATTVLEFYKTGIIIHIDTIDENIVRYLETTLRPLKAYTATMISNHIDDLMLAYKSGEKK